MSDETPAIELTGTITFGDMLRFYYFHFLRRTWWLVLFAILLLLLMLLAVAVLAFVFDDYATARSIGPPLLLGFVFCIAFIGLPPYLSARKIFKSAVEFHGPVTYNFSPHGIHTVSAHSSSDTGWQALWAVRETKNSFSIYFNAGAALVVPKRFFKDARRQDDWRRMVEAAIEPKKIEKPGAVGRLL